MPNVSRAAFVLALLAAGCANKPPPPSEPPPPSVPFRSADGTYMGTSTRYQADSRTCPSPGRVTLRVLDSAFSYRYGRGQTLVATIAPDGRITGGTGDVQLAGQVEGNRIAGDVSSSHCGYHFTTVKRGTPAG